MRPIIGWGCREMAVKVGSWLAIVSARNRHAAAGASQRSDKITASRASPEAKSRRLSLADGRRGFQERNWFSRQFISFSLIFCSFKAQFYLLQTVTVSSRGCVWGDLQQFTNFLKRPFMPDFQHNHLSLFDGQFREALHCLAFRRGF